MTDEAVAADESVLLNMERFSAIARPQKDEYIQLGRTIRLNKQPTFMPLSTYGDVMPLTEFVANVQGGGFIDYDGFGRYVKNGQETDIEVYPSDVKAGALRSDFDTIVWFNR